MNDFSGKLVAITGGATGIGFSFAKAFGEEGSRILIAGRRQNRLQEAVNDLKLLNIEASYFVCDVTRRDEVESFADFAWKRYGRVDVIINNAGALQLPCPVIETKEEDMRKLFDVNFYGVLNGSSVFGKRFIDQGTPAAIYNVGSENSLFHGVPGGAAYVASKYGVLAITESLREEMPENIAVGLICPGFVRSELGDAEVFNHGMDTDKFTDLVMQQIKNGEFLIVSHSYNIVHINKRNSEVVQAYEKYAPRYEGDIEFDIRTLIANLEQE